MRLIACYITAAVIGATLLFMSGCTFHGSAKKDQLKLDVPPALMVKPAELRRV